MSQVFFNKTGNVFLKEFRHGGADIFRHGGAQTDDIQFAIAHHAQAAENLIDAGMQFTPTHRVTNTFVQTIQGGYPVQNIDSARLKMIGDEVTANDIDRAGSFNDFMDDAGAVKGD